MAGWIGVDLDGTLAHFDRWRGPMHIGLPIPAMAKRVHDWHARGVEVRILTARASRPELIPDVQKWLQRNGFPPLAVTNQKDFGMIELWDDRAIQVLHNTGKAVRPNKLEETDKPELFDPDVVYVDDEDKNNEIEPSAAEIENFKRNIKASTDQSIHSLGDLLDALDEGDYAPGEATQEQGAFSAKTVPAKATDFGPKETESSNLADELPISSAGFVSVKDEKTASVRPKNSIVEIDLDDMDMGPDFDDESFPEIAYESPSEVEPKQVEEDLEATIENDIPTDLGIYAAGAESKPKPMDDTLDNQPLSKAKGPADDIEDIDLDLMDAMDDLQEELNSPTLVAKSDNQILGTPTLTAFPEDELDDFDDLPTFKVDRR